MRVLTRAATPNMRSMNVMATMIGARTRTREKSVVAYGSADWSTEPTRPTAALAGAVEGFDPLAVLVPSLTADGAAVWSPEIATDSSASSK